MQNKITTLKAAGESLRQTRLALKNLNDQESELKAALEKVKAQLANLPVESTSCDECAMCRIAGTFACVQLIANGKLDTSITTIFGFTAYTCFISCSCASVITSRSRPSRPSLATV